MRRTFLFIVIGLGLTLSACATQASATEKAANPPPKDQGKKATEAAAATATKEQKNREAAPTPPPPAPQKQDTADWRRIDPNATLISSPGDFSATIEAIKASVPTETPKATLDPNALPPGPTAADWNKVDLATATFVTPESLATLVPSETPATEPTATQMSAKDLFTQETEQVKAEVRVILDRLYKFEKPTGEGIIVVERTKDSLVINDQPATEDDIINLRNAANGNPGKVYFLCGKVGELQNDQKKGKYFSGFYVNFDDPNKICSFFKPTEAQIKKDVQDTNPNLSEKEKQKYIDKSLHISELLVAGMPEDGETPIYVDASLKATKYYMKGNVVFSITKNPTVVEGAENDYEDVVIPTLPSK